METESRTIERELNAHNLALMAQLQELKVNCERIDPTILHHIPKKVEPILLKNSHEKDTLNVKMGDEAIHCNDDGTELVVELMPQIGTGNDRMELVVEQHPQIGTMEKNLPEQGMESQESIETTTDRGSKINNSNTINHGDAQMNEAQQKGMNLANNDNNKDIDTNNNNNNMNNTMDPNLGDTEPPTTCTQTSDELLADLSNPLPEEPILHKTPDKSYIEEPSSKVNIVDVATVGEKYVTEDSESEEFETDESQYSEYEESQDEDSDAPIESSDDEYSQRTRLTIEKEIQHVENNGGKTESLSAEAMLLVESNSRETEVPVKEDTYPAAAPDPNSKKMKDNILVDIGESTIADNVNGPPPSNNTTVNLEIFDEKMVDGAKLFQCKRCKVTSESVAGIKIHFGKTHKEGNLTKEKAECKEICKRCTRVIHNTEAAGQCGSCTSKEHYNCTKTGREHEAEFRSGALTFICVECCLPGFQNAQKLAKAPYNQQNTEMHQEDHLCLGSTLSESDEVTNNQKLIRLLRENEQLTKDNIILVKDNTMLVDEIKSLKNTNKNQSTEITQLTHEAKALHKRNEELNSSKLKATRNLKEVEIKLKKAQELSQTMQQVSNGAIKDANMQNFKTEEEIHKLTKAVEKLEAENKTYENLLAEETSKQQQIDKNLQRRQREKQNKNDGSAEKVDDSKDVDCETITVHCDNNSRQRKVIMARYKSDGKTESNEEPRKVKEEHGPRNMEGGNRKRFCHFFNNKECKRENCQFLHEVPPVCRRYKETGKCNWKICMYTHPKSVNGDKQEVNFQDGRVIRPANKPSNPIQQKMPLEDVQTETQEMKTKQDGTAHQNLASQKPLLQVTCHNREPSFGQSTLDMSQQCPTMYFPQQSYPYHLQQQPNLIPNPFQYPVQQQQYQQYHQYHQYPVQQM